MQLLYLFCALLRRIINCHKKLPGYKGVNDIVVDLDAYDDIAPVSCDDTYPAARSDVQLPADSVTKDIEEKIPSSSDVRAVDSDGPAVTIVLFRTKIRHTSSVQVRNSFWCLCCVCINCVNTLRTSTGVRYIRCIYVRIYNRDVDAPF